MRKIRIILSLIVASVLLAAPVSAQVNPYRVLVVPGNEVNSKTAVNTAVDTAPVIIVKYIGLTSQASTFAVTDFDFIFTVAAAADTTINVQGTTPCGASVGTLDVNDTDCDTIGEIVNEINASANWAAVLVGALASDDPDTGGAASCATLGSTDAGIKGGVACFHDTTDALNTTVSFTPGNRSDIRDWLQGVTPMNPFDGYTSTLQYAKFNFVGNTASSYVYAVTDVWTGTPTAAVLTQTNRILYRFPTAATGVDKDLDFSNAPLFTNPGERIMVRAVTAATMTSPFFHLFGFTTRGR